MSERELPALPDEGSLAETPSPEIALAREMVAVERAKIAVEAKAVEASNDQDKRMAEFHTHRIDLDDQADQRRTRLAGWTLLVILAIVAAPLVLILYMAFWGNEDQRQVANTILTTGGIAIAGYGVIQAVTRGVKALLNR